MWISRVSVQRTMKVPEVIIFSFSKFIMLLSHRFTIIKRTTTIRLSKEGQTWFIRFTVRKRFRLKSKLFCLPVTWELPWPVPPTLASVPTTPPFVLWYSTNTQVCVQSNTILLLSSIRVRFCLLVARTCSAPVLRFEFPLPTLALSKSPPACSVCALFCAGVAVFVPSREIFLLFISNIYFLFLISWNRYREN